MSRLPAPARLVLDTNVWLDGLVFEDVRVAALFSALRTGRVVAATNAACREEWRRVLRYPALGLAPPRCAAMEAAYDALTVPFDDHRVGDSAPPLPRCKDADDQKFLELARAVGAVALLTRDTELLRLSRRCERAFGLVVQTPEAWAGTVDARV